MTARRTTRMTRRERVAGERLAQPAETAASPPCDRNVGSPAGRVRVRRAALVALGLAVLILVSYLPALSAGFVWDDSAFAEEPVIREGASGLFKIWFSPRAITNEGHYWPVVYTSFWIEHKLWGLAPFGYHLVNLLLHLIATLLVWRLLLRLEVPGALLAAAVFAVHPLHVESVAWVIERKDLLSAVFYLGAFGAWLRFVEDARPARYLNCLSQFVLALLSKSIAVTLPVALLIHRFWKTGRIARRDLLWTAPLFLIALGITAADVAFYRTREVLALDHSLVERALIAARALWFYAEKLVWPGDLPVIYPLWEIRTADPAAWGYLLAAVALGAGAWFGRKRFGRGPFAGLAFFAVTLSPVLGFVDYGYMQFAFVADRFQYLAGIGLMALALGAAAAHARRLSRVGSQVAAAGFAGVLIVFSVLTFRQSRIYRDPVTFFGHIVSLNPHARDGYLNLGAALAKQDRHEEALTAARRALETSANPANAHANAGLALMKLDRLEEAEAELRRARALDSGHRDAAQNLAELFRRKDAFEAAIPAYREVLELDADYALAYAGLGEALFRAGRYEEAVEALRRSLTIQPDLPVARPVRNILARALRHLGRLQEAAEIYERMSAAGPADPEPLSHLASVRSAQGRTAEADALLQRIRDLGPDATIALQNVAESLRDQERYEEALEAYGSVLAVDADFGSADAGRAGALFELGRYQEAAEAMERAIVLEPESIVLPAREVLLGRALLELGRPEDEAAGRFQRALAADPGYRDALDRLAMLRFGQERYREALELYRRHLEIAPDSPHIHSNLGATHYYLGEREAALRSFERALELDPTSESAQRNLRQIRADLAREPEPE